jgi:hypothetical protein
MWDLCSLSHRILEFKIRFKWATGQIQEDLSPRFDAIYALARKLKAAGVPLHGVGWQMHVTEGWQLTD